ncbi:HAD family hydrolase [Nakamurella leprariae]|uniref:HAD hydrolase-like protein n=1 Tax=Nakamurella leprariae TaxID=2803911 RepID=A0A938YBG0_9ACTN|nr:HAD hydrolase-like protein [Nakamurella leprariae]MBM9466558.1 HAD hydrolase-like protein [Nakamurella leprariae]
MTASRTRGVLFDLDGTLIDSGRAIVAAYRHAFEHGRGVPLPAPLEDPHVLMAPRPHEIFTTWSDGDADELVALYSEHYLDTAHRQVVAYPAAVRTLEELDRRGVVTGIVTNKSRSRMLLDLEWVGIDTSLLRCIITADDSVERKPDPTPVLLGLSRAGLVPESSWYVGDGPQDVLAGRAAGVRTAGAGYGYYGAAALEPHRPDLMLDGPEDVLSVLSPSRD